MRLEIKDKVTRSAHRILTSMIFIVAGYQHLFATNEPTKRLANTSWADMLAAIMPLEYHIILSGVVLVIGGIGLFLGSYTRLCAALLVSVLVPITVTVQMDGGDTLGPLFKNIALLGSLIFFGYFGAKGSYSFDTRNHGQRATPLN